MYSIAKAVRRANPVMTSVIALSSVFLFGGEQAKAQCVPGGGNTVTCTGSIPASIDLNTTDFGGTNTLNVSSILAATDRIWLRGSGTSVGNGTNGTEAYNCVIAGTAGSGSTQASCDIHNAATPPTCTSTNGNQGQTATCNSVIIVPTTSGPSGQRGPNVTIGVNASGPFAIGAGRSAVAVLGSSKGSTGGNGGSSCCFNDGGDGGDGVDGGTVVVNFAGTIANGAGDGIVASSIGGDGGNGGDGGEVSGDGGKGGKGGYGGTAAANFNAGAIATSGIGSIGVMALSQGGNGGNGGGGGVFVSEGGNGNSAGQAGAAQVTTLAGTTISTSGINGFGIAAYSIGGGGGSGAGGFGLFYSGGGSGSTGGNGGTVIINAASLITTTGDYAHGIIGASVGGGGGSAGSTSGIVALGGDGQAGGMGGTVTVNNSGLITTYGLGANAIEAQSIGGGGGNGANSGGGFALGGKGAGTTTGGAVFVTNSGVLNTYSSNATGILAQSIGGGGGNGGSAGGLFSFGGSGGTGADGGTVKVTNAGDIFTGLAGGASGSAGIVAQSIGGGGGNGGGAVSASPTFAAAFGGRGAMAGAGSTVTVNLDNANASLATAYNITTLGDASSAVIAQSIGGGGGNGGFAVAAAASQAFSVALGVGGNGGAGGAGGLVTAATKGSLTTHGVSSDGILAQSIGGGGGNGGFSVAASVSMGASIALSLGGTGGAGGDASGVTVSSSSDITTFGAESYGILAQSLGGGGGNGGFSVAASGGVLGVSLGIGGGGASGGAASTVDLTGVGAIAVYGDNAGGIAAQSIGGGGGNGGFAATGTLGLGGASVSVGGSGSAGGVSAAVRLDNSGTVLTTGNNSIGVLAQSLGGGGGNGGFAAAVGISVSGSAAIGIGGSGGGGQHADAVSIFADGGAEVLTVNGVPGNWNLVTEGANSAGISAQSIGGGGGNGGFAGTLALSGGSTIGLSLGGQGGGGSYAADAVVQSGFGRSHANNILTFGDYSAGIVSQSIGGGGGNGGFAVSLTGSVQGGSTAAVSLGGSGGDGSYAQRAEADSVGNITTRGHGADGILVQSIGGGGGNGGFSASVSLATQGYSGAVAIGGSGGKGNHGGMAVLNSTGAITTSGDLASGLIAQSIGGGGGNGGFAGAGSLTLSGIGVALGLGGSGSGGGNASTVDLSNNGAIITSGSHASAIVAQSVGGGGGNGGSSIGLSLAGAGGLAVAIGGGAGDGGNADAVVVRSMGNLATGVDAGAGPLNSNSYGILAQSLGGGGGNGGFAGSLSAGGAVGIGVSVGGTGAGGGSAGTVNVTSLGNVSTVFDNSGGILAQSVGGGGGNGGLAVSVAASATIEDLGAAAAVSVGGFGGQAGAASDVSVVSTGTILTQGFNAAGITAQSLGGGGGNGGFSVAGAATLGQAGIGISVGGFGDGGGDAAKATVESYGTGYQIVPASNLITIETQGKMSNGILAQSFGGGGGNGGFAASAGLSADGAGIAVAVGGFGAGGGDSDTVTVTSYNNIFTKGFESNGIKAQSIGGGGGNGGFAASASAGSEFSGSVSVGGFALSGGGDGDRVTVNSFGAVVTEGESANGILAQSLGGGGGNGGFALSGSFTVGQAGLAASVGGMGSKGGLGGAVVVASNASATLASNLATIQTSGESANGIEAQSIGGGGGNGGFSGAFTATAGAKASMSLSVGGFGAAGNKGGTVDVTSIDNILTKGDGSIGILAQSVGGGGGNGGFSFAGTVSVPEGNSLSLSASLGGLGGSGGNADSVKVSSTGLITTSGDHAFGLVAQSLGGGGGNGGLSVAGTFNFASQNNVPSITASVGGTGGSGGAASSVDVTRIGAITTAADDAVGLLAQSIGGGGGNGGMSIAGSIGGPDAKQITASVGGFGGPGSEAGNVTVTNTGAITTGAIKLEQIQIAEVGEVYITVPVEYGHSSHGILAQSIGGGGGNGGFAFSGSVAPFGEGTAVNVGLTVGGLGGSGGVAGNVEAVNNGLITTWGADANGVAAQSIGGGGGNGGSALTGQISGGDPQSGGRSVNVGITVGGKGGNGNVAGNVTIDQTGGIVTHGAGSNGILAQSIGGGGGTGGNANSLSLQLASSCTFEIPKLPKVKGCQSPKKPSVNVQIAIGGFGGTGNDAGIVTVANHSAITTSGSAASGIKAQSIGGSGGNGGQAILGLDGLYQDAIYTDYTLTATGLVNGAGSVLTGIGRVTVGGFGGAAGDGSIVTVTNEGVIQTAGDTSHGIEALSLGGGGGDGGNATTGVTGALSVGGFGMASGKGGPVTVTNKLGGDIKTTGFASNAILAQSIGGGGGNGGTAGGLLAMGGYGGASGSGGLVLVDNAAVLQTTADSSIGILAQSIGGGGGNGGGTGLSGIAIGGMAGVLGSTGDGGDVTVKNKATATILTLGLGSYGIEAQSVGGGGGNGGGSSLASAVTIGGIGGNSGAGGLVQVFNDGLIETHGDDAYGVFAQSIGGSGGNGGGSVVSAVVVGGFGGSSGNGGEVDVSNTNKVATFGAGADAVRAQSIGGGGGNAGGVAQDLLDGGLGFGAVSIGGFGGGAGDGDTVSIGNSGVLITAGDSSAGIRAQSIGGGGGTGGRALGLVAVGGGGGNAGDGGAVRVANNIGGTIWTKGIMSDGIFAQSVGGGGGNGGGAYSGGAFTGTAPAFSASVGGFGFGGGKGGVVSVENYALVQTDGLASRGIFAQSVGGGGGNGGIASSTNVQVASVMPGGAVSIGGGGGIGGDGGAVTVNNHGAGSIVSNGAFSSAIFAQSVGGGGGSGGFALAVSQGLGAAASVNVGGFGGAAGDGSTVNVTNAGQIVINGKNSIGIFAQSIGGGGGVAADSFGSSKVPVSIGGQDGAHGIGGDVSVVNTGSIVINGNNSVGIFAQSVGGGGGVVLPGGGVSEVKESTGGIGDGGKVTIDNSAGSIVINGENSTAMFIQSIGGGGGAVGLDADPPGQVGAFLFSGTSGGSGTALPTEIKQSGNLIATGFNSIALVAQSSAAGGVGDITVDILNPAGSRSLIVGGSGQGAGVEILEGANNVLNNAGVIGATAAPITGIVTGYSADDGTFTVAGGSPVSGTAGYGIMTRGAANITVNNTGVINGSIDLGTAGINAFFNAAGATFNPGAVVILGSGTLTNAGMLTSGGFNNVSTTTITGNLLQSATSSLGVDLDLRAATTDRITVNGTAAMSGVVRANLINPLVAPGYALPGTHAPVILTATGDVSHPNLTLQAFNTAVAHYALVYPNAQSVGLQYTIDYNPAGLTANQQTMGALVNTIQTAQNTPDFRPIATNLFYLPDVKSLGAAYDSLSGEGVAATEQAAFDANAHFLAAVGTQTSDWMSDSPRDLDHSWRLWLLPYGNSSLYGGNAANGSTKVTQSAYGIGGGVDYQITPHALIGVAVGGGSTWFKVPDRAATGSVDAIHFGIYGAWNEEDYFVSGAVSYDMFRNLASRLAVIPGVTLPSTLFVDGPYKVSGFGENPSGRFDSSSLSGHFEVGYREDLGVVQVTPFAGLEFGSLNLDGFTESNGGMPSAIGLAYAEQTINSLPSLLGVRFDSKSDLGDGQILSGWVKATWKHEFDISRVTDSSFIAAPGFAFKVHGAEPSRDAARTDVGVKMTVDSQVALFANFGGEFGGPSSSYTGTAGISIRW